MLLHAPPFTQATLLVSSCLATRAYKKCARFYEICGSSTSPLFTARWGAPCPLRISLPPQYLSPFRRVPLFRYAPLTALANKRTWQTVMEEVPVLFSAETDTPLVASAKELLLLPIENNGASNPDGVRGGDMSHKEASLSSKEQWSPVDANLLLTLIASGQYTKGQRILWKNLAQDLSNNPACTKPVNASQCRNYHLRHKKGQEARKQGGKAWKNRCAKCGEPRRGHVCRVGITDLKASSNDDEGGSANPFEPMCDPVYPALSVEPIQVAAKEFAVFAVLKPLSCQEIENAKKDYLSVPSGLVDTTMSRVPVMTRNEMPDSEPKNHS